MAKKKTSKKTGADADSAGREEMQPGMQPDTAAQYGAPPVGGAPGYPAHPGQGMGGFQQQPVYPQPGMGYPPPQQGGPQPGPQPGMGYSQQQPGMGYPPQQGGLQPGMGYPQPQGGMPGMGYPQQGGLQPGMGQPGAGFGYPPFGNPMAQMMQMMSSYMGFGGAGGAVDPSAQPFMGAEEEHELGLEADIVKPALVQDLIKTQEALPVQDVLDRLCLSNDGKTALGGLPKGCTIAFAGPPGKGKTRAMLEAVARAARDGTKCAYVVAEEGFRDPANPGRDDLCSRFARIAMAATGLDEDGLRREVLPNVLILLSQYHKGHTWDDFIRRYRYVVEEEDVRFVVVDSLNTLDPSHARTSDNLAVLKTYNHEHGVTCVTIGQIKDTGEPVGGEALMHTADAVFLIEEMSLGSKEMAEFWGGRYRERVTVIRARKSVSTPVLPYPIRVDLSQDGRLTIHEQHPAEYALPPLPGSPG